MRRRPTQGRSPLSYQFALARRLARSQRRLRQCQYPLDPARRCSPLGPQPRARQSSRQRSQRHPLRCTRPFRIPFLVLLMVVTVLVLEGCGIPRWPVAGPMTSPFGVRLRGWRPALHHGVDVAVPEGTPVRAMRRGRVIRAGWASGYGWMVMIDHGGQTLSLYAHLSEVRVQEGQRVQGQEVIGLSGKSGNVTGPHLHFEVWRRGWPEDPVPLLGGPPGNRK